MQAGERAGADRDPGRDGQYEGKGEGADEGSADEHRPQVGTEGTPERRRLAALAGHHGDAGRARTLAADTSPAVRATALGALSRIGDVSETDLVAGLADPDPVVRRRACEIAASYPAVELIQALDDPDASVAEAAAWALGERGGEAGSDDVSALAEMAGVHADPLCREAAVAALGAIGDSRGLPAILAATTDRPTIRRRAILALAPFEGPQVEAALQKALTDKDWQVRQAAEDLTAP